MSQIRLRLGEYDFSNAKEPHPYVERGVNKKIVHPKYNFFTYEYDLALVRLEEAIQFQPNIAPICLPASHDLNLVGMNATVTGWGRLSEGGTLPSKLQQVTPKKKKNIKKKQLISSNTFSMSSIKFSTIIIWFNSLFNELLIEDKLILIDFIDSLTISTLIYWLKSLNLSFINWISAFILII